MTDPRHSDQQDLKSTSGREVADHEGDAVLVPLEPSTGLFGPDPTTALARMTEVACLLLDLVRDRKLSTRINGREHLRCEAWTALGGMLGIVPIVVWTKPNEAGDGIVARVEARTLDGRVVGAAEAECSRAETTWRNRDPFTIRSMAQTRAISRALRAPLGQIVVLAGYEPAGAEEIAAKPSSPSAHAASPTQLQKHELQDIFDRLRATAPSVDWAARCKEVAGPSAQLDQTTIANVLKQMRTWLGELAQSVDV